MKKVLSSRVQKEKISDLIIDFFLLKLLSRRSNKLIKQRGAPIAVYGNDWIGAAVFIKGVYEKELIDDLFMMLNALGLDISKLSILDIGANIGNHSIQFSTVFNRVFAFEPNPRTFEVLASNTRRLGNVELFNVGLGNKRETLTLKETWNNIGGSSTSEDLVADSAVEINVDVLDDLSARLGQVDVMKIDVEGMEHEVLLGAEKLIIKFHPIICFEQHESEFEGECRETITLDWLRAIGYKIFATEANSRERSWLYKRLRNIYWLFSGVTLKRDIVEYETVPKGNYSMLFAVHRDRL